MPGKAPTDAGGQETETGPTAILLARPDILPALEHFLATGPAAVLALDASLTIVYANAAAAALLVRDQAALIGMRFVALFDPGEQQAVAAYCEATADPAPDGWVTDHHLTAGEPRVIEYIPRRHGSGETALIILTLRDISDTRLATRTSGALARVAASIAFAGSLHDTLDGLARSVVEATGIPACLLWLIDDGGKRFRVAGTCGLPEQFGDRLEQVWRSGADLPSLQAYRTGRPVIIPDAQRRLLRDPNFAPLHEMLESVPWDSLVCIPMVHQGVVLGILVVHHPHQGGPGKQELTFLCTVADQAAVAVERARLAKQASDAAEAEKHRQSEELLREKESQYRAIFETTSDGLIISTLDGIDVEANPAYCRMHGYTIEELRGLPANAYIHPDYHHVLDAYLDTIRAGGTFHARSMQVRKDGTAFHVEVHGTPFSYHGVPHALGVLRDITEQVQAYQTLERRVEERTRELSMLLDVSQNMTSTLELGPLLEVILTQLKAVVDYRDANVMRIEGDDLVILSYSGPLPASSIVGRRVNMTKAPANLRVIERREPVIIADTWDDSPLAESFRRVGMEDLRSEHMYAGSWLGVPLLQREQVVGMLGLSHVEPHYYTPRHARLALAIANQAAMAIENAWLYAGAQEIAALRERQRLARDLHDSVSQALYGISLGAHTARTLLERNPTSAREPIEYVLTLAEAGLAEMRALIFELRPESLANEGLVAAINHQLAALSARHGLGVDATLGEEPDVPLNVKETIYRIAQEALHNTVKHARAGNVRLLLENDESGLRLEVQDDGMGFDPGGSFPGHLGLSSMQERAMAVGGSMQVTSAPGAGAQVRVWVPH